MAAYSSQSLFRTRSLPLIFGLALLPLAAAVLWFYKMTFDSIESVLGRQTRRLAQTCVVDAAELHSQIVDDTALLTRGREINGFYKMLGNVTTRGERARDEAELDAFLAWWLSEAENDLYVQIVYYDGLGNPVYKHGAGAHTGNRSINSLQGINTAQTFSSSDRIGLPSVEPLRLSQLGNKHDGILRLARVLRPLRGQTVSPGFVAVDVDARSVFGRNRNDDLTLYAWIRATGEIIFPAVETAVVTEGARLHDLLPGLAVAVAEHDTAAGSVTYQEAGVDYLASIVKIDQPEWTVAVTIPTASYITETKVTGNYTLVFTGLFALMSVWIVAKLARRVQERSELLERANHELEEANHVVQAHSDALEQELQTAHDMQRRLMPAAPPSVSGFDIAGRCQSATHVGGDFFQYFTLHDGRIVLTLADVTDHGMRAAVPGMVFSGLLDNQIKYSSSPQELFTELNTSLHRVLEKRTFICFSMGELVPSDRLFRYANSGCPYPFHYRAAMAEVEELNLDAFPLGIRADSSYQVREVYLEEDDRVVFCSDGIIEASNSIDEMFGFERTAETIREACNQNMCAEELVGHVLERVGQHVGDVDQEDDQTIVVLGVG